MGQKSTTILHVYIREAVQRPNRVSAALFHSLNAP
jgi:hypothetical protein